MWRSMKSFVCLSMLLLTTFSYADTRTVEYLQCFAGEIQTLDFSEANAASTVMLYGTTRAITPGELFDGMSVQCIGLLGREEGVAFTQEFCEFFDRDGDRLFFRYERHGTHGTVRSLGSTGKYSGTVFRGSYEMVRYTQAQGMVRGCVRSTGLWEQH